MAHTTGAVGLRLCGGDVAIADVIPHDGAGRHERARVEAGPCLCFDPCEFRLAVARAWHDHTAGRRVGLVGLDRGDALKVTWTVGPPGRLIGVVTRNGTPALCVTRSRTVACPPFGPAGKPSRYVRTGAFRSRRPS